MTPDDIISTLEALRFLVRDPVTKTYALRLDYDYMKEYVEKHEKKAHIMLDPERLCWTPYVMGRPTNLFAMGEEANQPMQRLSHPAKTSWSTMQIPKQPYTMPPRQITQGSHASARLQSRQLTLSSKGRPQRTSFRPSRGGRRLPLALRSLRNLRTQRSRADHRHVARLARRRTVRKANAV